MSKQTKQPKGQPAADKPAISGGSATVKLAERKPVKFAYYDESWDSSNYANPLFIVKYPDGHTLSTMDESNARDEVNKFNRKVGRPAVRQLSAADCHALTLRYTRAVTAVNDLKRIRDYVTAGAGTPAAMPGVARKIRSAIKSAEGAVNNAQRFMLKMTAAE